MALKFPAKTLQFASRQDSLAVLALQVDLLLQHLVLLLLQYLHLLLHAATLLQLSQEDTLVFSDALKFRQQKIID